MAEYAVIPQQQQQHEQDGAKEPVSNSLNARGFVDHVGQLWKTVNCFLMTSHRSKNDDSQAVLGNAADSRDCNDISEVIKRKKNSIERTDHGTTNDESSSLPALARQEVENPRSKKEEGVDDKNEDIVLRNQDAPQPVPPLCEILVPDKHSNDDKDDDGVSALTPIPSNYRQQRAPPVHEIVAFHGDSMTDDVSCLTEVDCYCNEEGDEESSCSDFRPIAAPVEPKRVCRTRSCLFASTTIQSMLRNEEEEATMGTISFVEC